MAENKSNITSKVLEEHNIPWENKSSLSSKIKMEIPYEKYEEW